METTSAILGMQLDGPWKMQSFGGFGATRLTLENQNQPLEGHDL